METGSNMPYRRRAQDMWERGTVPPLAPGAGPYMHGTAIARRLGISVQTLRRWARAGSIRCVRMSAGGTRLYDVQTVYEHLGIPALPSNSAAAPGRRVAYARVSTAAQVTNGSLRRQVAELLAAAPTHEIVSETGSGLNFRRPRFRAIVRGALQGTVREVVVTHRDRLCRFAFDLVAFVFEECGVTVRVLNAPARIRRAGDASTGQRRGSGRADAVDTADPDGSELRDDLLAVITFFVARANGLRGAARRRRGAGAESARSAHGTGGQCRPQARGHLE